MLGVGHKFPAYSLQAVVSLEKGKAFQTVSNEDFKDNGRSSSSGPRILPLCAPPKSQHSVS